MSEITGFGSGKTSVSMSDNKREIFIDIGDAPMPMKYKIMAREDGTLQILNLNDSETIINDIGEILTNKIWARENREYESYELMGMQEALDAIVKYIGDNFVRKN